MICAPNNQPRGRAKGWSRLLNIATPGNCPPSLPPPSRSKNWTTVSPPGRLTSGAARSSPCPRPAWPSVFIAVSVKIAMMTSASITLTPLERQHRRAVDDLLFHTDQVHTHLDWYEPIEWLSQHAVPVRLAWHGKRLAGLLAVSQPLNGASWVRIAALDNHGPADTIFPALWNDLLVELRPLIIETVSLLVMRPWINSYLRELHFDFVEDVVTLERNGTHLPEPPTAPVRIRHLQPADLLRAARIDQAAFGPPWHMTFEEVRQASRIAEICTVAECSGQ